MKIAFISSGSSVHVKKLANGLVEKGHDITLFTLPDHQKMLCELDQKVKVRLLPVSGKIGYYLNAPYLKYCLKQGGFDLVNCHYVSGYGTLARLARAKPLVTAVFGSDVYIYPYQSKANMRRVIKNLDAATLITSTSHVMAEEVRKFYGRHREILVTPFGVDTKVFKPNRHYTKTSSSKFTFGIVKKLEDIYGIDILIKAFSELLIEVGPVERGNIILSIYGSGSKEHKYREMVASLGLSENVAFNGFIRNAEVPKAFYSMDVACFPSLSESFGVAAVEAMACGVPVITSDASGFLEVVEPGVTGFIVPKNDVGALSKMMLEVYRTDRKVLARLGENGHRRVAEYYDFYDNLDTYEMALRSAIEVD